MTTLQIVFHTLNKDEHRTPYIVDEESVEYICDGKEGSLYFNGYYYVEDHAPPYPEDDTLKPWERETRHSEWLPKTLQLYIQKREKEPYKQEKTVSSTTSYYNTIEEHAYIIEIYKRVIHTSTDKYSTEDGDGSPMNICFFPTNKQTIYFRILETLD